VIALWTIGSTAVNVNLPIVEDTVVTIGWNLVVFIQTRLTSHHAYGEDDEKI
jgi:hypothetical protein